MVPQYHALVSGDPLSDETENQASRHEQTDFHAALRSPHNTAPLNKHALAPASEAPRKH